MSNIKSYEVPDDFSSRLSWLESPALSWLESPPAAGRECPPGADQYQPRSCKRELLSKVSQESKCLLPCPHLTMGVDRQSHAPSRNPLVDHSHLHSQSQRPGRLCREGISRCKGTSVFSVHRQLEARNC